MRRRRYYLFLLALLLLLVLAKNKDLFTRERVEQGTGAGNYPARWFSLISGEVNERGLSLFVDGSEVESARTPALMTEEGTFLIPVSLLPDAFSVAAHLYDGSRLVLEKGPVSAQIRLGEHVVTVNGEPHPIQDGLRWEGRELYVPAEAVELGFAYRLRWDSEEERLLMTSEDKEKKDRILPSAYDYRLNGRAPRVKNQGTLGTCWAFASLMALESRLLPEEQHSFSEDHMSLSNSFHMLQNDGGEYTMSMAYLLAWQGPVPEEQDAYGDGYSPAGLKPVKHVQEIQLLPSKDYEAIKKAIFFCGGVQSSLYTSMEPGQIHSGYYNKEEGAYCYIGSKRPNHDVVIIGWDDNYPKENFNLEPEEDGAFICANSWGGEFGDEGYFYVSYYDSNIGIHNILYTEVEDTERFDGIYQTDLCGWVGQLGYGEEEAYFANIYTAGGEEDLEAVGFYATAPDTSYEVYTVAEAEDSSRFSAKALVARGSFENAGYYTVDFEKKVRLREGQRFAVIVHITTPGSVHPVAIEYSAPDKITKVDLSDGEGYVSLRGTTWERAETKQNCNICLKAYTRSVAREQDGGE